MNRRGFLRGMLAAGIAPAIVKAANIMPIFARRESGLLAPSSDGLYVVTEITGGNVLMTPSLIAREALRILKSQLSFTSSVNRQYVNEFRVGDVVRIAGRR